MVQAMKARNHIADRAGTESEMVQTTLMSLAERVVQLGLTAARQDEVLEDYCTSLVAAGVPILRVHVAQRAYHPEFGGFGYDWHKSSGLDKATYAHVEQPVDVWLRSPLYHLLSVAAQEMHENLTRPETRSRFPIFEELHALGGTDYFAMKVSFVDGIVGFASDPNDPGEGFLISWTCNAEGGFSDDHLTLLRGVLPYLGLALRCIANKQMAVDITSTYLGADAGARVLSGEIMRGSSETIHAVVWYFDLQGFTRLTEDVPGRDVIALLNAYFGEVVAVVEQHGGNVLKFMGDGLLAIFDAEKDAHAVDSALEAARVLQGRVGALTTQRSAEGLPVTRYSLALHIGDVLYGNIGGAARLDFTVIGSAVNTTARILGMCGPLDQPLILSADVARKVTARQSELVSLGPYMLRGVTRPKELFTLYSGQ